MFGKLIPFALSLALSFCSWAAQADETLDALSSVQSKVNALAASLLVPSKDNSLQLQIKVLNVEKSKLELEIKQILETEKRDPKTDSIHDEAYDRADDLMLGLTAISLLRVNANDQIATESSCVEARGLLRIFSRTEAKGGSIPNQSAFMQVINLMCNPKR